MQVGRGLTAIIGAGGKTTLLRTLAGELAEGRHMRVIVATSTKMHVPDWCPVLLEAEPRDVEEALTAGPVVCVGFIHEPTGKLAEPRLAFDNLASLADCVLVEADGAKGLPLKAHAMHEPVVPDCARRVVGVVGIDGVGKPISQSCHRPDLFAQLAGLTPDDLATPEAVAAVLGAERLHDVLLLNKVESPAEVRMAEHVASLVETPVIAGSLWRGGYRCLR